MREQWCSIFGSTQKHIILNEYPKAVLLAGTVTFIETLCGREARRDTHYHRTRECGKCKKLKEAQNA